MKQLDDQWTWGYVDRRPPPVMVGCSKNSPLDVAPKKPWIDPCQETPTYHCNPTVIGRRPEDCSYVVVRPVGPPEGSALYVRKKPTLGRWIRRALFGCPEESYREMIGAANLEECNR